MPAGTVKFIVSVLLVVPTACEPKFTFWVCTSTARLFVESAMNTSPFPFTATPLGPASAFGPGSPLPTKLW
jgi:hypothetical protein